MSQLKVNVELTEDDCVNFSSLASRGVAFHRLIMIGVSGLLTCIVMWLAIRIFSGSSFFEQEYITYVLPAACIICFYLFFQFISFYAPIAYYCSNGFFLRPKEIRIDEIGFHESSNLHTITIYWDAVFSIDEYKDLIALRVDKMASFLIPKRSFQNPEDVESFIAQAKRYMGSQ